MRGAGTGGRCFMLDAGWPAPRIERALNFVDCSVEELQIRQPRFNSVNTILSGSRSREKAREDITGELELEDARSLYFLSAFPGPSPHN